MAKTSLSTLVLLALLYSVLAEAKRNLYSVSTIENGLLVSSTVSSDGLCKSMVETQGYACQEHKVTTEDGYILSMQRIPGGRSGKAADKPPVLLQHGIFIDAVTWVFNPPDESLAFILADKGFDVWLANTRGTNYSRGHTSPIPNDTAYWNWSWDELAAYDLPAFFNYVHNQTGKKLHYVGHSLGTLTLLAALSQEKLLPMLRSAGLLSPIAHLNQIPSVPTRLGADLFLAEDLYWLGLKEFALGDEDAIKLLESICNVRGINCSNLLTIFTGPNCCINSTRIDIYLDNEPQPTATKNLIHLSQMIRKAIIAMYDYGNEGQNTKHYGQPTPPVYDMSRIPKDVPLFLSYGGKDMLSDVKDVQVLLDSLKGHDKDKLVLLYIESYSHLDFVMGTNAKQVVYEPLMDFFRNH